MATLREKVKLGAQKLGQVSEEELASLSASAERPAPPTSPLEAKTLGAAPDSAKMAGTAAQKQNALRIAVRGQDDQATAERREQTRTTATGEEASEIKQAGKLAQLQGLSPRVQALAEERVAQVTKAKADDKLNIIAESPEIAADLEALATTTEPAARSALLTKIGTALGVTPAEIGTLSETIMSQYGDIVSQIAAGVKNVFEEGVTAKDLDYASLGFKDALDVATLLGITPEEFNKLNVDDLVKATQAEINKEYSTVNELESKLSDPKVGAAERAEARKQLRAMGAVGVRAAESDLEKVAEEIEDASTVEFGGEDLAVDELLDDEYISGLAKRYLEAAEEDPWRQDFLESEPELAEWFDAHQETLSKAVASLEGDIGALAEIEQQNLDLADTDVGKIPDDVMQQLVPDWGKLTGQAYNVEEFPALAILNNSEYKDTDAKTNIYNAVTDITKYDKNIAARILSMSEAELAKAGILDNSEVWRTYKADMADRDRVLSMDPNSPDSVARAIGGPGSTPDSLQAILDEARSREASGLFGESPLGAYRDILDADNDGVLDNTASVSARLQRLYSKAPDPLKPTTSLSEQLAKTKTDYNNAKNEAYNLVQPFIGDGRLDKYDALEINKLGIDKIEEVYESLSDKLTPAAKKRIRAETKDRVAADVSTASQEVTGMSLQALINQKPLDVVTGSIDPKKLSQLKSFTEFVENQASELGPLQKQQYLDIASTLRQKLNKYTIQSGEETTASALAATGGAVL